jgi:cytidine deaminase
MNEKKLIELAKLAYKNSYSPYSKSKVGAALLCKNGKIFTGCNVENASYGLTMCAERVALYNAITAGQKEFTKIAIASNRNREFSPCGACRQALAEFNNDMTVIWQDAKGHLKTSSLSKLMPFAFKK